jgi:hypothetical protein
MYHSEPYSLSGRHGRGFLLPVVGLVSAALSAFLYAYINVYSPIAGYISILFVAGLAAGAAFPVAFAAKLLKCRNKIMLQVNGALTGVAALYLAWAFFLHVLMVKEGVEDAPSLLAMAGMPGAIWNVAVALSEDGWYSIRSFTPTGIVLWIFWLIEAGIVVGASFMLSNWFVAGRAFCEKCDAWCEPTKDVLVPVTSGSMIKAVKKEGLAGLQDVPPPDSDVRRWIQIHSQTCPQCGEPMVWGVNQVQVRTDDEGKEETVAEPVIPLSVMNDEASGHIARIDTALREARKRQFDKVKTARAKEA